MRAMRSGTLEYRTWHHTPPSAWHTTDALRRSLAVNTCHMACQSSNILG